ncbi:hypothetical protein CDAR_382291 [Caerostris darwini]|uniref:Uncharacterized protein n=1 Tax=Caerostris darwini TaxID=1538125 RepID=A0AAV4VXT4_9ARAC|nr:hypothetical protein CDAR_382291 [Caerostris darwini]
MKDNLTETLKGTQSTTLIEKTHFIVPFSKTLVNDTSRAIRNTSGSNSVFQSIPKTYDESLMSPKVIRHLPKHFALCLVIDIFHSSRFEKSVVSVAIYR